MICLQETKLQDAHVAASEAATGLAGWHHHWHCSTAVKGYSGTAIITRFPPPPRRIPVHSHTHVWAPPPRTARQIMRPLLERF